MSTSPTLAAALWDFDGTLADTEELWMAAEFELIERLGGRWSLEHADQLIGNSLLDSGAYILNVIGRHDLTPAWVVEELLRHVGDALSAGAVSWRPGVVELLASFGEAGIPCALVSATYRGLLDLAIAQLPPGTFAVSVAGDEVRNGKPHPEPYLAAAAALGVDPARCVAIEDSPTGVASALAAGCATLGVPHVVTLPPAPGLTLTGSLADIALADLGALLVG